MFIGHAETQEIPRVTCVNKTYQMKVGTAVCQNDRKWLRKTNIVQLFKSKYRKMKVASHTIQTFQQNLFGNAQLIVNNNGWAINDIPVPIIGITITTPS